jgi:two-component system response regulator GlrR
MSEVKDKTPDNMKEVESAKKALKKNVYLNRILGTSKIIEEVRKKIDLISSCDAGPSVLITGESGTGKELVASTIHYLSNRHRKQFVPVNCSAIPEGLFESELFGHLKGAFTGASVSQKGLVEEAEGGTLFLDEIGTVEPYVQVKFLRLLQEGEYKPLGESKICHADVRVIAATNRNLMSLINNETFREDLYYRLNTIPFSIPPLRERKEDIPVLVDHLIDHYSRRFKKTLKELSEDAMKHLISYQWPGNIRELENIIQQLVIMCTESTITASAVKSFLYESDCDADDIGLVRLKDAKKIFEKEYLINLLTTCRGNVVHASKKSGQSRTALWNLLKKHDIAPQQYRHHQ